MAIKFDKKTGEVEGKLEYKVKKKITIPVLSIDGGGTFYICPIEHPFSKILKTKKGNPKKNEDGSIATMKIIKVVDLSDNEMKSMVLPAVAYSDLRNSYPQGFLGLFFRIEISKDKVSGKQYKHCSVTEIYPPEDISNQLLSLAPPIDLAALEKYNNLTPEFWENLDAADISDEDF